MRRILPFYLFILTAFSLGSCDNEVDINADWKETIVVYGLLDPADSVQYVKIEKAFLDDKTGALIVAQNPDSLILDSVHVTLTPENGTEIILTRTDAVPKDSGIFGNSKNPLWRTSTPIIADRNYTLEVINLRTGSRITAKTKTMGPALITAPVKTSSSTFSIFSEYITVEFIPKANSYTYDVKMEVVYDEFTRGDTSAKTTKTVRWNMLTGQGVTPNTNSLSKIPRAAFLQFLAASIQADSQLLHRIKYINMLFYGGNQTLSDYISVNKPSIGIVQKTAEYTNIEGGYGIFASRCIQPIRNVKMDNNSVTYLMSSPVTKSLNFIK